MIYTPGEPLKKQMIPGPDSPYFAASIACWCCGREIQVYSWEGHLWMTDTPPPEPRPASLQYRQSRMAGGSYWANVCPYCRQIQGENFIYEPTGPLPERLAGRPLGLL